MGLVIHVGERELFITRLLVSVQPMKITAVRLDCMMGPSAVSSGQMSMLHKPLALREVKTGESSLAGE